MWPLKNLFKKTQIIGAFLFLLSFQVQAEKKDFHICYFSLNNEKEFIEMKKFTDKLKKHSPYNISVTEYMINGDNPKRSFKKMMKQKIKCDGLVISGHHTGAFGGARARGKLSIDFIEENSCSETDHNWFLNVKALWLQGCRTLGTTDTSIGNEISPNFHTIRVGEVLDEDSLERSFQDLNREFSTTLDRDNTLSSRYLRAFPNANIFGWTRSAPGVEAQSELSVPFHIVQLAKILNGNQFLDEGPQKKSFAKSSVLQYSNSIVSILAANEEMSDKALLSWENHGNVKTKKNYGFYNPDLKAYKSLIQLDDGILIQARQYNCLLKNLTSKEDLVVLDDILSRQEFIRFTYSSLLNTIRNLKKEEKYNEIYTSLIYKLRNSKELSYFFSKKIKDNRIGIINKIDYFSFYEEIYGQKENLKDILLDNVIGIFNKIPSKSRDEIDYKLTILHTLSKHDYLNSDKGISLLFVLIKDEDRQLRARAVREASKLEEKGFAIIEKAFLDTSSIVRILAVEGSSKFKEQGFAVVEQAIEDESYKVRLQAIREVSKFKEQGFSVVKKAIEDENVFVRAVAVRVAPQFGKKGFAIIKKGIKDKSYKVRFQAVRVAPQFGKKGFAIIKKGIKDKDYHVRLQATKATTQMKIKNLSLDEKRKNR